jgi:multiple antibiotic resistance protein
MHTFWVCFIPIFVAVDAVGVLPMFISLTEGFNRKQIHTAIGQSIATALAVGGGIRKRATQTHNP